MSLQRFIVAARGTMINASDTSLVEIEMVPLGVSALPTVSISEEQYGLDQLEVVEHRGSAEPLNERQGEVESADGATEAVEIVGANFLAFPREIIQKRRLRRIPVMGMNYVGKTCLIRNAARLPEIETYESTICDEHVALHNYGPISFDLVFFDTAGRDEWTVYPKALQKCMQGFVLVFSVQRRTSFNILSHIYSQIIEFHPYDLPMLIIGTFGDDEKERRVSYEEGEAFAKSLGYIYIELDARKQESAQTMCDIILREMLIYSNDIKRSDVESPSFFSFLGL